MTDKRKRRWIVLDIQYPRGHSTQALIRKLDSTAPGVWVALLTAAKRSKEQGTFEWFTETDAWNQLGLNHKDFKYDWKTFIRATGQLRMTNKTRSKDLQKIVITKWEDWQGSARTGAGRARKVNDYGPIDDYDTRRNRAISAPVSAPNRPPEIEIEIESEIERDSTTKKNQEPVDNPLADITDLIGNLTKPLTTPTPRTKEEQLRYLKGLTE